MLQRFQELKEVLPRVLEELGTKDSYPNESELEVLDNITKVLEVVEVGAQALGRRDCNLAKADKIFDFVLDNLVELGDPFHFAEKLKVRINERREPLLSGLFILLENPVNYGKTATWLDYPPTHELLKFCNNICQRLFRTEASSEVDPQEDVVEMTEPPKKMSRAAALDEILATSPRSKASNNSFDVIKKEIAVLKSTGKRPDLLEKVFNVLKSVPVSSVEAERAFSAAGLFVTKLRSSLEDRTIDSLCFLRSHLRTSH